MIKKNILGIIIVIAAIFIVRYFILNRQVRLTALGNGPIIMFGDSLIEGVGASKGRELPVLLSEKINRPIINAGKAGNTSNDLLARIDKDVIAKKPSLVIVVIGGNDFLRKVPKEQTLQNVRTIIQKLKSNDTQVILVGISWLVYNNDYKAIAREEKVAFVPHLLDETLKDRTNLMYDAIHPNDAGYAIFANIMAQSFK